MIKSNNKKILAIIPARGGSKRLKRKNIRLINNKPMISYAIDACKKSKYNIECYVSSEDKEICNISEKLGAKIHKRNKSLADDFTFKQDVIVDALNYFVSKNKKPDIVISLQANSPEIKSSHLDEAISIFLGRNRKEIFSVDNDLMQNGAFRIMDCDYVYQKSLSTYCGVFICDLIDVHTEEDLREVTKRILKTKQKD